MRQQKKRTVSVRIRLTQEEQDKLNILYKDFQYKTKSDYIRDCFLKQNKDYTKIKIKTNLLTELKRIGININQLTTALNAIVKNEDYKTYDIATANNILTSINEQLNALRKMEGI